MYALIKQSLLITLVAFFCVMLGHLILDITSENVADNSSDPKDNLSVAIKN